MRLVAINLVPPKLPSARASRAQSAPVPVLVRLLTQFLESLLLSQLGAESAFRQRHRGKITPPLFLKVVLLQTFASLAQLAIQIGLLGPMHGQQTERVGAAPLAGG